MGMMSVDLCFITGLKVQNISGPRDIYEYSVVVNDKKFILRFSLQEWETILTREKKATLAAMLHNDEWPTYEEVLLTPGFIDWLLRISVYPKNFDEKVLYYLMKKYDQGGGNYSEILFDGNRFAESFSIDPQEHGNIAHALVDQKYVTFDHELQREYAGHSFRLTNKGREAVKSYKSSLPNYSYKNKFEKLIRRPTINIYFDKRDEVSSKRIQEWLFNNALGYSIHVLEDEHVIGASSVRNPVKNIQQSDYSVFLVSSASNNNSILTSTIAVAAESLNGKDNFKLLFLTLDDGAFNKSPYLVENSKSSFDGRLRDTTSRMLQLIYDDWKRKLDASTANHNSQFSFGQLYKITAASTEIRNDVVLESAPFDIHSGSYSFTIIPHCSFWRFGIRLSNTQDIRFDLDNQNRHADTSFKDLHISVGHPPKPRDWRYPNRLELTPYHFIEKEGGRCNSYIENSVVSFSLALLDSDKLAATVVTSSCEKFQAIFSLEDCRYFKVFAWADGIPFDLDFVVDVLPKGRETDVAEGVKSAYNFPTLDLPPNHLKWLEICYQNLKEFNDIEIDSVRISKWDELEGLDPFKIDKRLVNGSRIKLWGIWHVDNESPYLQAVDKVLFAIKNYIKETKTVKGINTKSIASYVTELDPKMLYQAFDLITEFPGWFASTGRNSETFLFTLDLKSPEVYGQFLEYNGLNGLIVQIYGNVNDDVSELMGDIENNRGVDNTPNENWASEEDDEPRRFSKNVLPNYESDRATSLIPDLVGIKGDVNALARVIAYRKTPLPLAIGLFGDWGSGKSTFMLHLDNQIKMLTNETRSNEDGVFCERIVSITFNAWHYSDSNPWASIMVHLFRQLGKRLDVKGSDNDKDNEQLRRELLNQLNISRLMEVDAKKEKEFAEQNLRIVEAEILDLKAKEELENGEIGRIITTDVWDVAMEDPEVKELIKDVKSRLPSGPIIATVGEMHDLYNELTFFGRDVKVLFSWFQTSSRRQKLMWALFVILPLLVLGVSIAVESKWLHNWFVWMSSFVVGVGYAVKWAIPKVRMARGIVQRLAMAKNRVEEVSRLERIRLSQEFQRHNQLLTQLQTKLIAAEEKERSAKDSISKIEMELRETAVETRLEKFITSRFKADDYEKHLGLISLIHNDLHTLKVLLEPEKWKDHESGLPPVERIVLFVDDLDRLNSAQVVKVLEAIHLLLAMDGLFVVVAGVSSTWLKEALSAVYVDQFTTQDPLSYLEKIFQIPVSIKPMNSRIVNSILGHHFNELELEAMSENSIDNSRRELDRITLTKDDGIKVEPDQSVNLDEQLNSKEKSPSSSDLSKVAQLDVPSVESNAKKVLITKQELEFMYTLAPIIGRSPRAVKQFINLYRILRSHEEVPEYSVSSFESFRSIMFLLAINVGFGHATHLLYDSLRKSNSLDVSGWVSELRSVSVKDISDAILPFVVAQSSVHHGSIKMEHLKLHLKLVRRYSFYELV